MSGPYVNKNYFTSSGSSGVPSNASFVGGWFRIDNVTSIGVLVNLTSTSSPQGTWGFDVTNDEDPRDTTDANLDTGVGTVTLSSVFTGNNPDGTTTDRKFLGPLDPSPRAKWGRFKYTRTGGGSASNLMKVSICTYGIR